MDVETGGTFRSTQVQSNRQNYVFTTKDGVGYGLLQWSYSTRKQGLLDFTTANGGNYSDYDIQLQYMVYEGTKGGYKTAFTNFLAQTDLGEATKYFCEKFEQAGTPHMDRRITAAQRIYEYYVE